MALGGVGHWHAQHFHQQHWHEEHWVEDDASGAFVQIPSASKYRYAYRVNTIIRVSAVVFLAMVVGWAGRLLVRFV